MRRTTSTPRLASYLDRPPGRQVCVVSTASLPWQTGTAVNPLLRAAYLAHETSCQVTLVIPWLAEEEQKAVFPKGITFTDPSGQAQWVRNWVLKRCNFKATFDILFYPGRYDTLFFSISPSQGLAVVDSIPATKRDIAILEEPEHLTWFEGKKRWTDCFNHVVGIMHTNYEAYVREEAGALAARIIAQSTTLLTRVHCHKVIKLSDAIQELPRSTTQFVHGVADGFIQVGRAAAQQRRHYAAGPAEQQLSDSDIQLSDKAKQLADGDQSSSCEEGSSTDYFSSSSSNTSGRERDNSWETATARRDETTLFPKGAYFIGKAVWGKGYGELFDRMAEANAIDGCSLQLDCYGHGEDLEEIKARAAELKLDIAFKGAVDHLDKTIHAYKVLVNASLSDVVATTTAEALAMGKWVLVADHPENDFFRQFDNALIYTSTADFLRLWRQAVTSEPPPLTAADCERLTWQAATQRLLSAAAIASDEWPSTSASLSDSLVWQAYKPFSFIEVVSRAVGKHHGGRAAEDDLERVLREDPQSELVAPLQQQLLQQRRRWRHRFSLCFRGTNSAIVLGGPNLLDGFQSALEHGTW